MPGIRRASYIGYSFPSRYQTNHESLSLRQELLKKEPATTDIPSVIRERELALIGLASNEVCAAQVPE